MKIGDKTNFLTLLCLTKPKNGRKYGIFRCDCGTKKEIRVSAVQHTAPSQTKSCGCHRKKIAKINGKSVTTHGMSRKPIFAIWQRIKLECTPTSKKYKNTSMAPNWASFEGFWMWARPLYREGQTIVRIDMSQPFQPDNCKFVDNKKAKEINRKSTCLEKYGVESVLQSTQIKEKIRQTNLKRYGTKNVAGIPQVQNKRKQTCLKKYGVDSHMKTKTYQDKFRQIAIQQGAETIQGRTLNQIAAEWGVARQTAKTWIDKLGYKQASQKEKKYSVIESIIKNILHEHKITFQHNVQLGCYVPDFIIDTHKLIIECDGLYWHSDAVNKDKRYHKKKLDFYESQGYRGFFFRENEIHGYVEIVESIILNSLNMAHKIYARQCQIVEIDKQMGNKFLLNNHLMGKGKGLIYGLEYNGEIVSAIQITNRQGNINIERFCHQLNTTVVGGWSRLIKHIENNHIPQTIQTFIDRRYGRGFYLNGLGFTKATENLSFVWIKDENSVHRMKFPGNTGYQYGWYKLWDCGQAKYVKQCK